MIVFAVPVMLDEKHVPDYGWMDEATAAVGAGLQPGTLVVYETTLPVGTTRTRYGPMLESASGLPCDGSDRGFHLAFSPERVFSGRILEDLKRYPKLVGGINAASAERAVAFYSSVLEAEVWNLGTSETAEFAKLAETTYRDVNIALANEFARYANQVGVDILEVIRGANSQPFSHIHQPGIGVGGHCIPVYPHFLLAGDPGLTLVRESRSINDGQVERAVAPRSSISWDRRRHVRAGSWPHLPRARAGACLFTGSATRPSAAGAGSHRLGLRSALASQIKSLALALARMDGR